ncbi:FMN-binding protein [Clostridium sp. DJ247]|uniref:FMN-binding protein n=1 Tax=Clostridium sp. DJ247 TaxID=2726188 RepID=UPI0016280C20|nr:FMN-binding protein [Clostridium sp. DJ247]MBC2582154.1 FMN-binding protein [Clostridium sp. DJ247]
MRLFLKIVLSIIIVIILFGVSGIFFLTRGIEAGRQQVINNVDLRQLSDGTYDGKYESGRWSNELMVTIKDNKISKIDMVKDVTIPKSGVSDELFNKVVKKQNTDVDVVSGATVTSKAYLKAIEDALKKGK